MNCGIKSPQDNIIWYLEFGTSKMDPKPFFRPALHEAESKGIEAFIRENTKTSVDSIDSMDELVQSLAFALERRVKEIITQKGLIDTGTLRASVQAVPGSPSGLPSADEVGASADVEVSA